MHEDLRITQVTYGWCNPTLQAEFRVHSVCW